MRELTEVKQRGEIVDTLLAAAIEAVYNATGEMVAVNQETGTVEWDTLLPSSPYGAATVTKALSPPHDGHFYRSSDPTVLIAAK